MAELTIDIPAEFTGLMYEGADFVCDAESERLEEGLSDDALRSCQQAFAEASSLRSRLEGLDGGARAPAPAHLLIRIVLDKLYCLGLELMDKAGDIARTAADLRPIVNAVEWFTALGERADAALIDSVPSLGPA